MRIFIFLIGLLILAFFAQDAQSDDKYHHASQTTQIIEGSQALGLAASGHQFYWGQKKLQGSFSAATHGDSKALSFALGKRVGKALLTGSVTQGDGGTGIVGSANWTF